MIEGLRWSLRHLLHCQLFFFEKAGAPVNEMQSSEFFLHP